MIDVRERLSAIEALLRTYPDTFATFATKADLHREMQAQSEIFHKALFELKGEINKQTWRIVTYVTGFGIVLSSAIYFIVSHVK